MSRQEQGRTGRNPNTQAINDQVIAAQEAAGVFVTDDWWEENVGSKIGIGDTAEEILSLFNEAFAELVRAQEADS